MTIRFFWFMLAYIGYIGYVDLYFQKKNLPKDKLYIEYLQVWPFKSVMVRFWNWKFRNFVVDQQKYDDVLIFVFSLKKNERSY